MRFALSTGVLVGLAGLVSLGALEGCSSTQEQPLGGGGSGASGGENTGAGEVGGNDNVGGSGAQGGDGGTGGGGGHVPQTPPTAVDCTHHGSGRDIQVGNPEVETGANIVQVDAIGDVDWNNLEAGDTVRIFWRQAPYREKILIKGRGTAEQPIRVCGVPGPEGQLPRISGENATTRTDLDFGGVDNTMQDLGVVVVWDRRYETRAEHIHIEGLAISDTVGDGGTTGDLLSYTATDGTQRTYRHGAACLRIQEGRNIVIRGNELSRCGNGLFLLARVPESQITRDVLIEGNYLHDNGLLDYEGVHSAYIQGIDITIQFNWFGATRSGAAGNNLKMRVAGDVIRYNYFERGARVLDLVEVEDHAQLVIPELYEQFAASQPSEVTPEDDVRVAEAWAKYQRTFVYGNVILNAGQGAATNLVHYSFDNTQNDRRRGTLWFYHNTIVQRTDESAKTMTRILDQGPYWGNSGPAVTNNVFDGYATMRALNNVIVLESATPGSDRSYFEATRYRADKLAFGKNWITSGWDAPIPGYNQMFPGFGNAVVSNPEYVYPGGNDSHHVTGMDNLVTGSASPIDSATFRPVANSQLIGAAEPLPAEIPAEHRPIYQLDVAGRQVQARESATTLGAIEN